MVCLLNLKLRVVINLIRVDKYLDVTILPPKRNLVPRFNGDVKWRGMLEIRYLGRLVTFPDILI